MEEENKPVHSRFGNVLKTTAIIATLLVGGFLLGLLLTSLVESPARPSKQIVEQTPFPIYLPKKLPGNYKIDETSFVLAEGTLVFKATDGAGGSIAFTEQAKPANFNFEDFYTKQLSNSETLNGTPFPSVFGTSTATNAKMVSIVADDSWIIASTQSPLSKQDLETIARSVEQLR